jgi:hypothetical protein
VLAFGQKEALLAAVFAAISASTSMSFIHALVGQNSALAVFPLAITLLYLAARERSIQLALLAAMVVNAVFWIYVMALPYVLAPFGLYLVLQWFVQGRRRTIGLWIAAGVVVAFTALAHAAVIEQTARFVGDLSRLLGGLSLSGFYRDYLTEDVFVYATGLSSYSIGHNAFLVPWLATAWPILKLAAFALAAIYFVALRRWERNAPKDAALLVLSLLATYLTVWFYYTFITRFGYASFKMVAWLQFIAVPFLAWIAVEAGESLASGALRGKERAAAAAILAALGGFAALNVLSVIDYDEKSYSRDRVHGSLINSYGVSGNSDFARLPDDLKPRVAPGETLALGFTDYIENLVAALYASDAGLRLSLLSHDRLPDDDSFLPDVHSRRTLDTSGNSTVYEPRHFAGGAADYYLLPSAANRNSDIVKHDRTGVPVWSNATFALYRRADLADLLFTGRGFSRIEHFDRASATWWWPQTFRWTAEGGEIYHLLPSAPGRAYRIGFSAIAGIGRASGIRTVEVWHNGVIFDELSVHGTARLLSKPYYPVAGVNRLVLRIKEKTAPSANRNALWNRDLPAAGVGQLNLVVSDVVVERDGATGFTAFPGGLGLKPQEYLDVFETFDGFDIDGWLRDRAHFTTRVRPAARSATLTLLVPGNLRFEFPYHVGLSFNGVPVDRQFDAPGEYKVKVPLPPMPASGQLAVEITPQAAAHIADGTEQREVLQSIRLGELEFKDE